MLSHVGSREMDEGNVKTPHSNLNIYPDSPVMIYPSIGSRGGIKIKKGRKQFNGNLGIYLDTSLPIHDSKDQQKRYKKKT